MPRNIRPGETATIEFPCGLSLDEGVERASKWWNEVGRIILKQAWDQAEIANDGDISKNDGIHRGLLFHQMNTREQHKVLISWYNTKWRVDEGMGDEFKIEVIRGH